MGLFSSNDIKIELSKYIFSPGDIVNGKVITSITTPIKATNITLSFYGERTEKRTQISTGNGNSQTSQFEDTTIFGRQNIILAGEGEYDSMEYPFSFQIPGDFFPIAPASKLDIPGLPSWANTGLDLLTQAASMSGMLGGASYRFFLEARIDIPWAIDITEKTEITVNRMILDTPEGNI